MTTVILLTPAQADHVRGASIASAAFALMPVELTGGTVEHPDIRSFLPAAVLDDPAHAALRDYLAALPQVAYATIADLVPQDD